MEEGDSISNFRIVSMRLYKSDYAILKFGGYEDNKPKNEQNAIYVKNWNIWESIYDNIDDLCIDQENYKKIREILTDKNRKEIVNYD